ncbi:MAG: ZIP family metal transporter [Gemmatimonadetes bacterium]|nr:ZIP family metal transporter [Gemmatimonadota bacterium]
MSALMSDPTLVVLVWASLAAFAAGLGVVPRLIRGSLSRGALGWANALAAGLMLGVAYLLLTDGLGEAYWAGSAGAAVGVGAVILIRRLLGTAELDLNALRHAGPEYGYQVMLVNTVHAAFEGVAIGAAMSVSTPFGISTALALAIHNVPEGMVLTEILHGRGVRTLHAATLAVAANLNQVLVAVVTFALVSAAPAAQPWALGIAVGSLLQLVLAELLPESYHQAGHTSIALVALLAMGMVVGLAGVGP